MPTIGKSELLTQLTGRVRDALNDADSNWDGAVNASERAATPDDVRGLADSVADYYFSGGNLPNGEYLNAYASFASEALDAADSDGDGVLTESEQANLPTSIFNSVVALRANTPVVTPPAPPVTPQPPPSQPVGGAGVLGISGTVAASEVTTRTVLATGLNKPTDLAFNPHDNSLWVVNLGDDSSVKITGAEGSFPSATRFEDDSDHFMNNPMGLAFSPMFNEFASIQDTTNDYNGAQPMGNMFMGPTLWPADHTYDGGHDSHLDMLHHSPSSVGIEAGTEYAANREYFVFNGHDSSIDRYFFGEPHVHGGTDHADGITVRYAAGDVASVPGVPSHMALDDDGQLFIADTGNGRIVRLDTTRPMNGAQPIPARHNETPLYRMNTPLSAVTDSSSGLQMPSGIAIYDDHLLVGDHATGHIKVFTKDGGLVGDMDTGLGANALTGIAVKDGRLYVTDAGENRVLELSVN